MPRTRELKPAFFQDEDLATLSRDHRLLFAALWTLADREGRLKDRPAWIKLYSFPFDADVSPDDISRMLTDLAAHGGRFIARYSVGGKRYLRVNNFNKHQHIHPKEAPSAYPDVPEVQESTESARDLPGKSGKAEPGQGILPLPSEPSLPSGFTPTSSACGCASQLTLLASGSGSGEEQQACQGPKDSEKIRAVFTHYRSYHPKSFPNPMPTSKEWRLVQARLREGHSVDVLCKAIDGYHVSPFHLGENDRHRPFLGLDLLMRDGTHVAEGIRYYEEPKKPVMSVREMRGARAGQEFMETLEKLGMGDKQDGQA